MKLRPEDPEGQARLGLSYLLLENLDKAQEHLEEAKKSSRDISPVPSYFWPKFMPAGGTSRPQSRNSKISSSSIRIWK